jgi:hypothetical protein
MGKDSGPVIEAIAGLLTTVTKPRIEASGRLMRTISITLEIRQIV